MAISDTSFLECRNYDPGAVGLESNAPPTLRIIPITYSDHRRFLPTRLYFSSSNPSMAS